MVASPRICTLFRWLSVDVRGRSHYQIGTIARFGYLSDLLHHPAQHVIPPASYVLPLLRDADPTTPAFAQGINRSHDYCTADDHHLIRATGVRTQDDFFFSSRRRHTRCGRDWSSDVCSSD